MNKNETIHDRISQLVDHFGNGKNTVFASAIGSNEANVRGYKASVMPKFDFLEKIARNLDINLKWLLTGEGSMLQDDQKQITSSISIQPDSLNDSIIYKIYKEKDIEVGALKEEVGALKERLHQLEEAQGTVQFINQQKQSESVALIEKAPDAFTQDSPGGFGKDVSHMRKPASSQISSVSKT